MAPRSIIVAFAVGASVLATGEAYAASATNADWPCVQRKIATLTSAQMWDGPAVDGLTQWRDDAEIAKLVTVLASRRVPVDEASAAIEKFAAARPAPTRDEALKLLFAGLVSTVSNDRAVVIGRALRSANSRRRRRTTRRRAWSWRPRRSDTTGMPGSSPSVSSRFRSPAKFRC
jgi:hypothetical protein